MDINKKFPSGLLLRHAKQGDLKPMATLLSDLFAIETDFAIDINKQTTALKEFLLHPESAVVLVAEVNNVIVGMVTGQLIISTAVGGKSLLLEDLIVKKEYRGQGIGKGLLISIENWAKNHNILRMQLVADFRNQLAVKFYQKNQYIQSNMTGFYKIW